MVDEEPFDISLAGLRNEVERVASVDLDAMCGADVSSFLGSLSPLVDRLIATRSWAAARVVETNQHNEAGAKSGASFVGDKTGRSEAAARRELAQQRRLKACPLVADFVRTGRISIEKGDVIARNAPDDDVLQAKLLEAAPRLSVESLQRLANELTASDVPDKEKRWNDRQRQFVNVRQEGKFHFGTFQLLNENMTWLPQWRRDEAEAQRQDVSSEFGELCLAAKSAEAFSRMLSESGGSNKAVINFHLDLQPGQELTDAKCELAGLGPVPFDTVAEYFATAAFAFIGTADNKLVHFGEAKRRSATTPLPEMVKRAIAARDRHRCTTCGESWADIDHIQSRGNGGDHEFENLQALCRACHDAKTRKDAPWTAGGIYAKAKERHRRPKRVPHERREEQPALFERVI